VGESSSAAAARRAGGLRADYDFVATMDREIMRDPEREVGYEITDSWDEIVETLQRAPVSTDTELGGYMREFETRVRQDMDEIYMRLDDEQTERQLLTELLRTDHRRSTEITELRIALHGQVTALQGQVTALQKQMSPRQTTRSTADQETINATSITTAQLQEMIDQGGTAALVVRDALRSTNRDDSHNSGSGVRRTERATRECTYTDFLKCQPLPFKGTEGVASLSQWCERMESVFHISKPLVMKPLTVASDDLRGALFVIYLTSAHLRSSAPIIKDWVSDSEDDSEAELPLNASSFVQPTKQVKTPRSSVKPVETSIPAANPKTAIPKPNSHGNIENRKACFVCKSLTHLIKDCDYYEKKVAQTPARNHAQRGNHQQYARMTLPNPQRHVVSTTVLTKSKHVPLTTARQVTTAISPNNVTGPRPAKTIVTKPHSPPRRHINHRPTPKASTFPLKATAVEAPMVNDVNASMTLKRFDYNDALGRSKSVMAHGGYVSFDGNPKGGKISGKGKIKTGKLDFDDVYFIRELKFNLFSVSQMCDKKNSVLFTNTKCIVLSPEFKLPDENQVLLRVPRENNMYNVDLKSIVPSGDLTCLFAKETLDETPSIGFMRPFGCPMTILNTLDPLGSGPTWLFDIDTLPKTMNYQPVTASNQSNPSTGIHEHFDAEKAGEENFQQYVLFPLWSSGSKIPHNTDEDAVFKVKEPEFEGRKPESKVYVSPSSSAQTKKHNDKTKKEAKGKSPIELSRGYRNLSVEFEDFSDNSINEVNAANSPVPAVGQISTNSTNTFSVVELEDITYSDDEEDVGAEANFTNLETTITVSLIPTTRVHKDHPGTKIIGDLSLATQTRSMTRVVKDQGGLTQINNKDFHTCTKWVFRNKKDERDIVVRNKARLVAQGHTQKKGIDYEEVFAPVLRIEAIRLFLAYVSFMGFMVYQIDVKNAFLYGTIEKEVYVCQSPGFEDHDYPEKVCKVVKGKIYQTLFIKRQKGDILLVQIYVDDIIFGSTNKDLCKAFEKLMNDKFQMSSMGELTFFLGLQVKQKPDGIFISQDKYVAKILRKFGLIDGKSASTPIDTKKPLLKDPDGEDVDVHTYRSMIGSLMYLNSSRPDIMFTVCARARFQVTPKVSNLHAVKRIFRYLKGKPHLDLWYPKDSPFNLVAYSDSDYAGASLDRMPTTRGC
nr:putative ribonuclease H-like domain-containing protein [Tanacetum cinerariifolium]